MYVQYNANMNKNVLQDKNSNLKISILYILFFYFLIKLNLFFNFSDLLKFNLLIFDILMFEYRI